jgi:uncharacterized protein (DUF362 family)
MPGGISRRSFLKKVGAAVAGMSLPLNFSCAFGGLAPDNHPAPGIETVSIVGGLNIEEMVFTAIELAGGLGVIQQGETVVIKPNLTAMGSPGDTCRFVTNPQVLRAVIRAVKARTAAGNITVADARAFGPSTWEISKYWGIADVIQEEGVNFLGWEEGRYSDFTHEKIRYLTQPLKIPQTLSSFDHFINVPMLKNHKRYPLFHAVFSICLTNLVGVLEPNYRIESNTGIHTADIGLKIPEIGLCLPNIAMNVVDATEIILKGGPATSDFRGGMQRARPNLILASTEMVACDTVGVAVLAAYARNRGFSSRDSKDYIYMERSVFEWDQIRRAHELGLGRRDPAFIEIVDRGVDTIDAIIGEWI